MNWLFIPDEQSNHQPFPCCICPIFCQWREMKRKYLTLFTLFLLSLLMFFFQIAKAQSDYEPVVQSPILFHNEARTVYLGNLARRDNGIPPLRWNLQLTHASRWFSWDSTVNRPPGFCGHQDSQGGAPWDRALAFGYLGFVGAENAFCGYVTPEQAIQGWMNSPGHRANLLNPDFREIGLGYYRRDSDGRGYVAQVFGSDVVYAPVVIENEAPSTTNPNVNLYIYNRAIGDGFAAWSAATQMMVSNDPYFHAANWEPYNPNQAWTLISGMGWREAYVKTRDVFNRTMTVSDSIYLGENLPTEELNASLMSTTQPTVTLYNLNGAGLPQAQFSLGWLADDSNPSFNKWWGNGQHVTDAAAWGGTAYHLYPGDGESFAWVYDWKFIKDVPLTAYFRLKVNNNSSGSEVARISVKGGGTEYGPISLRGTDFSDPHQYQEFAVNFTFNSNPNDTFLIFQFWRSGSADVYVDAVSIFSVPQAVTSPLTWNVPGQNYRGQGVWVRYTDGNQFSGISEGVTQQVYTISGNAGVEGATLTYTDHVPKSVTAGSDGHYIITVSTEWTGTVIPSRNGYRFTPDSRSYSEIAGNVSGENYVAILSPTPFNKTSPAHSMLEQSLSPTFSWEPSSDAVSYEYCYSSVPAACTNWFSVGNSTSVTLSGLTPGYTYYWQVRAVNQNGHNEADGDVWWSFTTTAAAACAWPPYTQPATPTFGDVPMDIGHWSWVERLANSTITAGCGAGNYCPFSEVVRAQMAIFLLRGKHCGSSYTPPAVGASTGFGDVPLDATYAPWVKQLAAEGITAGCGNGNFCPLQVVNRAQMAIFLLRAKHGATYSPPAVGATTGFGDVPLGATYAAWVKQLAAEGVTAGCGGGNFCPLQNVNRAQMATFLVRAFGLP
jgi:uncharacterized protein YkwD